MRQQRTEPAAIEAEIAHLRSLALDAISTADLRPFDDLDPPQNLAPSSDEILVIERQMIPEKVKRGDSVTLEGERACPSSNLFTVAGCVGLHPMQVSRQRAQQCDGLVGLHLMQYRAAAVHRQRLIAESRCAVFFVSPMSSEILKPGSRCSVCTRCRSTVHGSMLTPTPTWTRPPSRASTPRSETVA